MAATKCKMDIVEKPDFSMWWQCSNCGHMAKDTNKFMKRTTCPSCNSEIIEWDEWDEDYE